ncbi:MAG: DMT family transporter [Pseudomonadota bacterium]
MTDTVTADQGVGRAWIGPVSVLCGGICIGFAPIGLRLGLDTLGPQAIAMWRYIFALPILLTALVLIQRRGPAKPVPAVILAGVCFALDIALWHWALERTTVANATFIVNLGNICVGFLAWMVLRERPTLLWGVAVLIAMTGAGLLSQGGPADGKADLYGDLLAVGAAILVAGYVLFSKVARGTLSALDAIFWLTLTEVVVAFLLVVLSGERIWPETAAGFQAPLFLALVVQVGGQGLIIFGLGRTPAAIAGVLVLVQPVTAAAISWQLFDEPLNGLQGFGGLLILTGVYLAQRSARQPVPKVTAAATQI